MTLSVITPLHEPGNRYVLDAYASMVGQPVDEWIVLENAGGKAPAVMRKDKRVRVLESEGGSIGKLKREACERAKGDWIVELDADDMLAPGAIARVREAFRTGADFVHSDFAEFSDDDKPRDGYPYSSRYGWEHYPAKVDGRSHVAMRAPLATEHNVRRVEWAPNHVRAWRRKAYEGAGGHDASMPVGDDHDLVVRMLLSGARFARVPECLYLYRVHGQNTVATKNAAIQAATVRVYNRRVWELAEKWTRDRDLARVDLCGGIDTPAGYTPIDKRAPGGIACDLDGPWALEDSSVGVLRAHDAVEHLRDPVHTMNEAYRVLAPGGWLMISVPSSNGMGAFCDPTHVSFWNRLSFRYYTDPAFARYVPEFAGRFQVSRVQEWYPTEWHRSENVPYVEAHLFCMKAGFRAMGEVLWS